VTSRVSPSPTSDEVAAAAARLDGADEHLLALVARLPLAPLGRSAPFLGRATSTGHRRARQLCDRGLLAAIATPVRTSGRPARLLLPTQFGLAVLAQGGAVQPAGLPESQPTAPTRLLADLPGRLAAYELLALLAATGSGVASLAAWERPWRRLLPPSAQHCWDGTTVGAAARGGHADLGQPRWANQQPLPARARHRRARAARPARDARPRRRAPGRRRHAAGNGGHHHHDGPPRHGLGDAAGDNLPGAAPAAPGRHGRHLARPTPARARRDLAPPRSSATDLPALGPFDRAILDLVGRHAFLPTRILATVLDRDARWAQGRRARLAARGLLRVVPVDELNPPELARHGLLELTQAGLVVLAAQLGLPLGAPCATTDWPAAGLPLPSARAPRCSATSPIRSGQMRSSPPSLVRRGRTLLAGRCWSGGAQQPAPTGVSGRTGMACCDWVVSSTDSSRNSTAAACGPADSGPSSRPTPAIGRVAMPRGHTPASPCSSWSRPDRVGAAPRAGATSRRGRPEHGVVRPADNDGLAADDTGWTAWPCLADGW